MSRRITSLSLIALIINLAVARSTFANSKVVKGAPAPAEVKTGLARIGTGPAARIEVKLRDGARLKGYIGEVGEDGFVVVDEKSGTGTPVSYAQVGQVKARNLSTGAKIAIGVGIALGVLLLLALLAPLD